MVEPGTAVLHNGTGPLWIPKSKDAQVSYISIQWRSTVAPNPRTICRSYLCEYRGPTVLPAPFPEPLPHWKRNVWSESKRRGNTPEVKLTHSLSPFCIYPGRSTETAATWGPLEGPDWHWGGNDQSQDRQRAEEGEKARANRLWKAINPEQRIWGTAEEPPASPGGQRLTRPSRTWQFGSCPNASSCDLTPHLCYLLKALGWGLESSAGRRARKPISLDLDWASPAVWGPPCFHQIPLDWDFSERASSSTRLIRTQYKLDKESNAALQLLQ